MNLIPKIGLEIHLELSTNTKMFCGCLNDSSESHPNINICEICTGQPGALPVLNKESVVDALKIIKAVGGEIQNKSVFARKNYFYPDLPKGYQISQYELPIGVGGEIEYFISDKPKKVRIRRIHLEEDTAKLSHSVDCSLIDFNRAGVPLMEIVTEPDIGNSEEAKSFMEELILLIKYLKISEVNLEKGEIRMEANISVGEAEKLGTKVEIKNLNSMRALANSISFEIERQKKIILADEKVIQETRGWNEEKQNTFSQRIKEEAEDYRYFPEPDLPPLIINDELLSEAIVSELPSDKRKRFQSEFNLTFKDADLLIKQGRIADFFEEAVSELLTQIHADYTQTNADTKVLFNYLTNDLIGLFVKYQKTEEDIGLTPHHFAHLISKVISGEYNSKMAKEMLKTCFSAPKMINHFRHLQKTFETAEGIEALMKQNVKIIDKNALKQIINEVIKENKKAVDDYKSGKESSFEFLIGQVIKITKGQADIDVVREILKNILK